jgi:hypothetical protein
MAARRWRFLGLALLCACALALFLWDPLARRNGPDPLTSPSDDSAAEPSLQPTAADAGDRATSEPCRPNKSRACRDGDLYWLDSCGRQGELAEACQDHGCNAAQCLPPPPPPAAKVNPCGAVSAFGECIGEVARACVGSQVVSVDCAEKQRRCVMTGEGATCLPRDDKLGCGRDDAPRCSADRLRQCVDGRWVEIDCGLRRAICKTGNAGPHCEQTEPLQLGALPEPSQESCDGLDNDGDGKVDEDAVCDPVPLVAFVPSGAKLANLEVRMQQELAILNNLFAPTSFRWAKTDIAPASLRIFDPKDLEKTAQVLSQIWSKYALARQTQTPAAVSGGFDFYVAVLFTEKLTLDPPKSAISTLPNARCGGVRVSDAPSPPYGLIVLSEARQPETLTHEMGHYLGLCHTHEDVSRFAVTGQNGLTCQISGDGICDTADDPGPAECALHDACALDCSKRPAHPDPFNVMSYYIGCRRNLSSDQIAEARRNLTLRRGWFRCLDPRDCPCEAVKPRDCPPEMSCRPGALQNSGWACGLDGPALPGASCVDASQCSLQSFCAGEAGQQSGRCIRPCQPGPACTCKDVGLAFQVCGQDIE